MGKSKKKRKLAALRAPLLSQPKRKKKKNKNKKAAKDDGAKGPGDVDEMRTKKNGQPITPYKPPALIYADSVRHEELAMGSMGDEGKQDDGAGRRMVGSSTSPEQAEAEEAAAGDPSSAAGTDASGSSATDDSISGD